MSRRRNDNTPGDAHELTFTCYRNLQLLKTDRTCTWFLESLDAAKRKCSFAVWAYVLMPEHVHPLLWPTAERYSIADIRHEIKSPVARRAMHFLKEQAPDWLPKLTRRRGSRVERLFWQSGGGYDRNVRSGKALCAMIDYIHLNPVQRGLVEHPGEWRWSSYKAYHEGESPLMPDPIDPVWLDTTS